jgi:hypothetical protein
MATGTDFSWSVHAPSSRRKTCVARWITFRRWSMWRPARCEHLTIGRWEFYFEFLVKSTVPWPKGRKKRTNVSILDIKFQRVSQV